MSDRYQTAPGSTDGTFPTSEWFAALRRGIDGPLGTVLDVGCAEGVMSVLAAQDGATLVWGIDTNADRIALARQHADPQLNVNFSVTPARAVMEEQGTFRTVILSMIAHWIGRYETARLARLAERNLAVVFREANDHYAIPENGTWFPTFAELDATVGGVRTHEELLLTQDNDKRIWAATYRTDIAVEGDVVHKRGYSMPLAHGRDLHGDAPFRPTIGAPLADLTPAEQDAVRALVRNVADKSIMSGWYPTDFSPRNIIVGEAGAFLVDLDEIEPYTGAVGPEYLPIWQATLSTIGVEFSGDLRSLL